MCRLFVDDMYYFNRMTGLRRTDNDVRTVGIEDVVVMLGIWICICIYMAMSQHDQKETDNHHTRNPYG